MRDKTNSWWTSKCCPSKEVENVITGPVSLTRWENLMRLRINMEFKIAEWRWEWDRGLARKIGDGQIMKCGVEIWSLNLNFKECSMKVKVTRSCTTLCHPMDCTSLHGILQARILEWVAIPFSRGSSQSRDLTQVSCMAGRFFTVCTTLSMHKVCRAIENLPPSSLPPTHWRL